MIRLLLLAEHMSVKIQIGNVESTLNNEFVSILCPVSKHDASNPLNWWSLAGSNR